MNTKILKGLISLVIASVFVTQIVTPLPVYAGNLNWDNPSNRTPFTPKPSDFVNPRLLMSVVGCTGIVNKVAEKLNKLVDKSIKDIQAAAMTKVCSAAKKGASAGSAATSTCILGNCTPVGTILAQIIAGTECPGEKKTVTDPIATTAANTQQKIDQCFNGIAINLARNQLTAMTKATFNWANTGLDGDPFFVTNMGQLLDNIQQNVLTQETNLFRGTCIQRAPISSIFDSATHTFKDTTPREKDGSVKCLQYKNDEISTQYPYGADFARAEINSYKAERNIDNSLKQDLTNWLPQGATINSYSNDFAQGGWNAWLALTQHPGNNPLGYTMIKSQDIADKQAAATNAKTAEINRNNGYQDQTTCADTDNGMTTTKCKITKVITPGSLIHDKLASTINSPERQTEMVRTINDALNSLFASLLGQLFDQGLTGLSSIKATPFVDVANLSTPSSFTTAQSGSGSNPSTYNPSVGLGNKYTEAVDGGDWDASNNTPALAPNIGTKNTFYTVSKAGDTQLFSGSHSWRVGEKAFFDGTTWKVGVPKYVVDIRGGMQMQYDFNATAKNAVKVLPQVAPKLGELDYCIPGPNANWAQNSSNIREAFNNYIDSIYTKDATRSVCDFLCITHHTEHYSVLSITPPLQYQSYFTGLSDLWNKITKSELFTTVIPPGDQIVSDVTDGEKDYIQKATDALWSEYTQKINALYGPQGTMQSEFLYDAQGNVTPNSGYLPMATTGLSLTRNLVDQATELNTTVTQYQDDINQNNANIYRLNSIKDQINAIIDRAQARRASRRKTDGLPPMKQICLNNEKITYVVNDQIK